MSTAFVTLLKPNSKPYYYLCILYLWLFPRYGFEAEYIARVYGVVGTTTVVMMKRSTKSSKRLPRRRCRTLSNRQQWNCLMVRCVTRVCCTTLSPTPGYSPSWMACVCGRRGAVHPYCMRAGELVLVYVISWLMAMCKRWINWHYLLNLFLWKMVMIVWLT